MKQCGNDDWNKDETSKKLISTSVQKNTHMSLLVGH